MWLSPVPVQLTSLPLIQAEQGWGVLGTDKSVQGHPLLLDGRRRQGIGTHAKSDLIYAINGRYRRFQATVGIDDEMNSFAQSSITFTVLGDGRPLWSSGLIKHGDSPKALDLDVTGVNALELKVGDGGDGINGDHADWADPVLTPASPSDACTGKTHLVQAHGLSLKVDGNGRISAIKLGADRWIPVTAGTTVEGASNTGQPSVRAIGDHLQVFRKLRLGHTTCSVRDLLTPDRGGIRWDVEIRSSGPATTAPIATVLTWPTTHPARFWAAWNDPIGPEKSTWHDPLQPQPLNSRSWSYGETPSGDWTVGDVVSLPLFTVMPANGDAALTFIQSPNDSIPEARLATSKDGEIVFSRNHLRIGGGKRITFTSFLAAQKPDWRASLKAISSRFPAFFTSPLASAKDLEGCGAYSGDERVLTPQQARSLRKMAFSTMWKLSDDYAYMGMFLPPTKNPHEAWTRTPDSGSPAGYKPIVTSAPKMNGYGRMLKSHGFHLLDYFNACEFGVNLKKIPATRPRDDDWKNASQYLANQFPHAPILDAGGTPLGAWQGGWVMDPGNPAYRTYLLDQARLYLNRTPDSDGICIDRADYLHLHNPNADDRVSWYGAHARALVFSWQQLLKPLGEQMHRRGKAIFGNLMDPRLDITRQLDGLYCEFGNIPTVLNGVSFLCLDKPLLAWTSNDDALSDDYFQRELYLGAFPTAPYPTNNHCIEPSHAHDRWYLDYGPLFNALKGRRWVLTSDCIAAEGEAKVNLFQKGENYVAVIAFAGKANHVRIHLKGIGRYNSRGPTAILPGSTPKKCHVVSRSHQRLTMDVPVHRGCAVVQL